MSRFAIMFALLVLLGGCTEHPSPAEPGAPPPQTNAAADPAPHAESEQRYVPLSRVTETWGTLQLGRTSARIAAFAGSMHLERAGVMSTSAGSDLAGAEVFRIDNAEDYFARNTGHNAFCSEPPRWLAVRQASSDDSRSGEIWVALLTVTDWAAYRPDVPGYCAGGLYTLEANEG